MTNKSSKSSWGVRLIAKFLSTMVFNPTTDPIYGDKVRLSPAYYRDHVIVLARSLGESSAMNDYRTIREIIRSLLCYWILKYPQEKEPWENK